MKKKIFFLVNIDSFFLSHRFAIAQKLLRKGYEVHIATEFTKHKTYFIKSGFKIHNIKFYRNSYNLFKAIYSLTQIFFLLKKNKPDILHLISLKPIIFGGLISFVTPVKFLVISITGLGSMFINDSIFHKFRERIFNFFYKIVFLFPNLKVILQNKDDFNYLIKKSNLKRKDVEIIKGSGVNLNLFKFSSITKGPPVILMASRIIKDKGVIEYIEAIKYLKKLNFNGIFFLIGDIDIENPSAISDSLVKYWKSKKLINYLSHQNNIQKYMKKSSLIVLPSYREGFPKVLMEAAACGRAIITTNVPGCKDAIIDNVTGILIPAKNPTAIAKAILKIFKKRTILKKMGKAAREHAQKNFNINDVVSKHLYIYKKLLND
jgi:glycosyltransferase involved in cell wall biosynthesis